MSDQTPDQLLSMILDSDRDKRLEICKLALEAGDAARDCFLKGHTIEIDNLNTHIRALSVALVKAINGELVDPSLLLVAAKAAKAHRQEEGV